jgi:hypothetical protein
MTVLINILLGLLPTMILAGAIASDERAPVEERVAGTTADRRSQRTMFLLIYGLWSLTLAMWNWMRSTPWPWIALWALAGIAALIACAATRRR